MKNIRLRAIEPEDLDLLFRIENDQELWGMSVSNVPYSRYVLRDYVAQATNDIYADGQVRFIVETEDGETVGIADLVNFDAKNNRAELGIIIERQHRRRGYGRQILTQLADYALRVLHLHQLYAYVEAENKPCLALFQQMGYRQQFVLKDWLYDGLTYHDAVLILCKLK